MFHQVLQITRDQPITATPTQAASQAEDGSMMPDMRGWEFQYQYKFPKAAP
jgi:hypothetical protein